MVKNIHIFLLVSILCLNNSFIRAESCIKEAGKQLGQLFFLDDFHKAMSNSPYYTEKYANTDPHWRVTKKLYDTYVVQNLEYADMPRIPKIIHQIWLGSPFPKKYIYFQSTWKKYHPDWEYRLWTEKEIEEFGLINKAAYDESTNYGQKSDIARYEILYRIGGLYVDTDFECFKNFDILHHCFDFYTGLGDVERFYAYMGLIGSAPGNKILEKVINSINIHNTHVTSFIDNILHTTGPALFTKIIQQSLSDVELDLGRSIFFPLNYFYPLPHQSRDVTYEDTKKWIRPETFALHHWHVSWNKKA